MNTEAITNPTLRSIIEHYFIMGDFILDTSISQLVKTDWIRKK